MAEVGGMMSERGRLSNAPQPGGQSFVELIQGQAFRHAADLNFDREPHRVIGAKWEIYSHTWKMEMWKGGSAFSGADESGEKDRSATACRS